MNPFAILGTAIALVFAVVWYLPAMTWGYQVSKAAADAESGDFSRLAKAMEGPAPLAWLRNRNDLRDTYRMDELTRARTVHFQQDIALADLLPDDQVAPDAAFEELFATAQVPGQTMEVCAEMITVMAIQCDVYEAEARMVADGVARITGKIAYLQSYETGDPSGISNGELQQVFFSIQPDERRPFTSATRLADMQKLLALCEDVRETYGNCLIGSVSFSQERTRGDFFDAEQEFHLGTSAGLTIYVDQDRFDETVVRDTIREMAAEL